MFQISYNKIIFSFLIFFVALSSLAVVSAGDCNLTHPDSQVLNEAPQMENIIYVDSSSGDGGNGSLESPFSSISHAVSAAGNNSRIILNGGVYKGLQNTGILIDKDLTIESSNGEVTINGENKYSFFKIKPSSSLILINIKFVNGYTKDYTQLGVINNGGNLTVLNSSFSNMNTVMGAIYNEGTLNIVNSRMSDATSKNMAQLVTNIGNCSIINSRIVDNPHANSGVLNSVYNYDVLRMINAQVSNIISNSQYDDSVVKFARIFIANSSVSNLELDNASVYISNSKFGGRNIFRTSDVFVSESVFSDSYYLLSVFSSNFTAFHSIFDLDISAGYTNFNITYSVILGSVSGGGKMGSLYAPYNWWGSNSGPSYSYFWNSNVSIWAIAGFDYETEDIPVGPQGKFSVTLNKWYDGNDTFEFNQNESLPSRTVSFESQNGKFLHSSLELNKIANNYLIDNILDSQVFAVVDSQRLMLTVGKGLSEYTYFVSPDGHDGPEDGSYEKPFLTLQYAVSKAGNGNTICILPGLNKNLANNDISIEKNLTIVGLGEGVVLQRANSHNMFIVRGWGSLVIKNIKFIVEDRSYTDSLFIVYGGDLDIINCSFVSIDAPNVIYTSSGNGKFSQLTIKDSLFSDIRGSAVTGNAIINVVNSTFEKFTNFYLRSGVESYNCVFPVTKSICIYNSTFRDNRIGIVNLHPYTYSSSSFLGAKLSDYDENYSVYAYVENTTFMNNVFGDVDNYYASNGIGLHIHDNYGSFHGFINNCTFVSNKGAIAIADEVNNSKFIDNFGQAYGGEGLVRSPLINNSIFVGNVNLYRDGEGAYIGDGIAAADLIVNSVFMYNKAAFGGAVAATKEVHYCVFVNNTAEYEGSDIFSYNGDVDYSLNWWGDNQKPESDKIFKFLGTLTLDNWVIMTLEYISNTEIRASLDHIVANGSIYKMNHNMPQREVFFSVTGGEICPEVTHLNDGAAYANLNYDKNASDFKAYATIDNQVLDVDVRNSNTRLVMSDISVKGSQNKFNMTLVNVNGYKISNQDLVVEIIDGDGGRVTFMVSTDDDGFGEFNVDYPIGVYTVNVRYLGNGYFDRCNCTSRIEVLTSITYLNAYNRTYYGKDNRFHAVLTGEDGVKLVNLPVTYRIIDSKGNVKSVSTNTDSYGVGEIMFSLDVGEYTIKCEYLGDSWYSPSFCEVHITVYPVKSQIIAENVTLYGEGNIYSITLKDSYGTLIRGENVYVRLSQGGVYDEFTIRTDDMGVASLTVNYLPGTYGVDVRFAGDELYGPSNSSAVIKIKKVLTLLSGFYHTSIPLNGVYSVSLTDMNGRPLVNQTVRLNMYQAKLVKQYAANTDGNGEASFIIDLPEGNYLATFDYDGNIWYDGSSGGATIIVTNETVLQAIQINGSDLAQYYGENKFFIIQFNDPNAYNQMGKEILVTISSGTWHKAYTVYTDIFGLARLQINLNPGEYEISYKYSNAYYNIFGEGANRISVYRAPTTIFAGDLIISNGNSRILEVFLRDVNNNPIKNMQVNVDIGGVEYNITTDDEGIAKMVIDLDVGNYTVNYTFNNPNYISSNYSSKILVIDSDKSPSELYSEDVEGIDNQTVKFTVCLKDILGNGIAYSEISLQVFSFDGVLVSSKALTSDGAGSATFDLNLDSGNYIAKVSYEGNNFYLGSSNVNTININSSDDKIKTVLFVGQSKLSNSSGFYVALSDANGTLLKDFDISFIIGNNRYSSKTDSEGKAYLNISLSPDVYDVKIEFEGDDRYKQSSISSRIFIIGVYTQLHAQKLVKYYRNGTQFHAVLLDSDDNPVSGKLIYVSIDGVIYRAITDDEGWITVDIDFKPGFYEVECYYYDEDSSKNSFDKTNITVLSTVIGQDEVKYYGDSPYLTITFLNGAGLPIVNSSFIINIDGNNYYATLNGEGTFHFDLNLESGDHVISVINPYDGLYVSYKLTILPTVVSSNLVKVINTGSYYIASFLDKYGNPLKNRNVDIVINGLKYVRKTDSMGIVKLAMNVKPNSYLITAINPVTKQYVENTVRVLPSIVANKNIVMYYGSAKTYSVKVIGKDMKAVGAGKIVTFKVNGRTCKIKTNRYGYALLKIGLSPKKYVITATYNGYTVSNRIVVKAILTARDVSAKKSNVVVFKAKLVNGKGKADYGKKITFTIKNKKYLVRTNKYGVAILKLKLNPGKYVIKSSYGKSRIANKIIVKN